jgi:predicted metal-binding membrane protein
MKVPEKGSAIESVMRRDRFIVSIGLASLAAISWIYVFDRAKSMSSMEIIKAAAVPDMISWNIRAFLLMFIMWTIMMFAMMTFSTAPMVLEFASTYRKSHNQHSILTATALFVCGYFFVWTLFSGLATFAQSRLHSAALLSAEMAVTSRTLGGVLFVVVGVFQWTELKHRCLRNCRSPIGFFMNEWREGLDGVLAMGIKHGTYCLGCCFSLMAILFVTGVMNLLWMSGIAVLVVLEKLSTAGPVIARAVGGGMFAWGLWMIFTGL